MASRRESTASRERYVRQARVFPDSLRLQTALIVLNGKSAPWLARFLAAGSAALGLPAVYLDHPGFEVSRRHWFLGYLPTLMGKINPEVRWVDVDPSVPAEDISVLPPLGNAWVVCAGGDFQRASKSLYSLAVGGVELPVITVVATCAGLAVVHFPNVRGACMYMDFLAPIWKRRRRKSVEEPELAAAAAGIVLSEVVSGGNGIRPQEFREEERRLIGYYNRHRPRRLLRRGEEASVRKATEELFKPLRRRGTFRRKRITAVGAGALGNWVLPLIALDGHVSLTLYDGDREVELSNLNRQIFLSGHVGEPKARALAAELRRLDPKGRCKSFARFVSREEDFRDLSKEDLVLSLPDNDGARLVCADAAWSAKILFGTAGSSPQGAQSVVTVPGRACYRCVAGGGRTEAAAPGVSCSLVEDDAVVCTNMVAAGLLVSELRLALGGLKPVNLRFEAVGGNGNRIGRMITDPPCPHRRAQGRKEETR